MENPTGDNPFASPVSAPQRYAQNPVRKPSYPVFCMIMFITSIVFASLRVIMIPLGIIGYFALRDAGDPQLITVPFEILTNAAIAFFGLLANGLMLARKKIGIPLAWILVVSVVSSILVGIWQGTFIANNLGQQADEAMLIGAYIGIGMVVLFRIVLLGAYCIALTMFTKWISKVR